MLILRNEGLAFHGHVFKYFDRDCVYIPPIHRIFFHSKESLYSLKIMNEEGKNSAFWGHLKFCLACNKDCRRGSVIFLELFQSENDCPRMECSDSVGEVGLPVPILPTTVPRLWFPRLSGALPLAITHLSCQQQTLISLWLC